VISDRHLTANYARHQVEFVRGEGARLWDADGAEYLDFLAGISVSSVGHAHPAVVAAIRAQAGELIHVGNLFYTDPMVRLAERLAVGAFGPSGRTFFTNSGAEAVEAAIKCARKARQGGDVVSVHRAFHGRTYGALSATPQESKQAPFAPLVPGFRAVAPTRRALRAAIDERTAAVLLEPVQGEGGIWPLDEDLLVAARERCDETAPRSSSTRSSAAWGARARCGTSSRPRSCPTWSPPPRRSAAACRSGRSSAARGWPGSSRRAITARPFPAGPWSPPPRTPRSTSSRIPSCTRACARSARGCARGSRPCPA
jgi:hypothetical protein